MTDDQTTAQGEQAQETEEAEETSEAEDLEAEKTE